MNALRRFVHHRRGDHTDCDPYLCSAAFREKTDRKFDAMNRDYEAFKQRLDHAKDAGPEALKRQVDAELDYIGRTSPRYAHLTYDPFTLKSRRF
jgi:hypothetical protein